MDHKSYTIIDYQEKYHKEDLIALENCEGDYLFPSSLEHSEIKLLKHLGKIIGYVEYMIILDEMEINRILVAADWRGKGLASNLLSHLSKQNSQIRKINLEVKATNKPALALYHKLGFKDVGLRKKYYKDGSDAILMSKKCIL